jgi:hypothetical protein
MFACCGGCQWPILAGKKLPLFPHGGTGEDGDGRLLLLAAEAMLGVFFGGVLRVTYRSLYVGLSDVGHNFEETIFLTSTSKSRVITTTTILHQLILGDCHNSFFAFFYLF